jgi:hypothetical protein
VRQAGLVSHVPVAGAADVVRSLAAAIRAGIDGAHHPGVAPLPAFDEAEWCRVTLTLRRNRGGAGADWFP